MNKKDIKNLTFEEFKKELLSLNVPVYRAQQVLFWIYKKGILEFDQMQNLPVVFKDELNLRYYIGRLQLKEHLKAKDRAQKFLFELADGKFIETVLIPSKDRNTVCISTQVGCKFKCAFCASAQRGFARNLTASEILSQALFLQKRLDKKITNYVFMGMGEPLDNFENLAQAIKIMNDKQTMNIGARRVTVSTCGLIPGIAKLCELGLQVNLSVSLHATNDKLRDILVPVNKRYSLKRLVSACENYVAQTNRLITLEYILLKEINDSFKDADQLAQLAKQLRAKVNLINYSAVSEFRFEPSDKKQAGAFIGRLLKQGVNATLRLSRGGDIAAACGQLSGGFQPKKSIR